MDTRFAGIKHSPSLILQPLPEDANFKTARAETSCASFEIDSHRLAVKKDSKNHNTLKEFIDFAKANPAKITVGISGKFSGHHMASLQFMR